MCPRSDSTADNTAADVEAEAAAAAVAVAGVADGAAAVHTDHLSLMTCSAVAAAA